MIDHKRFGGIMNLDDKPDFILPNQHIDALNGRFYGAQNANTFQNVVGNSLINNSLPDGNNECIGSFYDGLKQRLIWFNWNSNNRHGIYQYDLKSFVITPLLICFTNSTTDILQFDLDFPIASVDIIYTSDIDGDILTWTARNARPKELNILSAINNIHGSNWLEEFLDIQKAPPTIPIKSAYENDDTVIVNNLRKKLFKPKYRYWYSDNQKSVWSSQGEIPIPLNYTNPETDTDPTKNCKIGCIVQTGGSDVVKIEIAMAESLGNVFSNFFSVIILNKSELLIPDNDTYVWRFFNDKAYNYVDLDESILLYDYVPYRANAQALLNGNVIIYGGIVEGKNPTLVDGEMTTDIEYPLTINTANVMSVTQYGMTGFSSGNIHFIVVGNIRFGDIYTSKILVGATSYTISYTCLVGDTPLAVLVGLSLSATSQGFIQVSIGDNDLVISRANQVLLNSTIIGYRQTISTQFVINNTLKTVTITGGDIYSSLFVKGVQFFIVFSTLNGIIFTVVSSVIVGVDLVVTVSTTLANETIVSGLLYFEVPINSSLPAYNSSSKENLGLVYFDEKGVTNGVNTNAIFNVNTQPLGILNFISHAPTFYTPYINASILSRPPLDAKYYQWVRTKNLTKESYLSWISDRTYKDDKYAYISIESIAAYKILNPTSIISYDFLPGDRIKFYILFNPDGTTSQVYGNEHDYEIYGQVTNPDIKGVIYTGKFIKIVLPITSSEFDFSSGLTLVYDYYYIELYTPAKAVANGLDVYYEFGEMYEIGDAGLATAFHQGQTQNQSTDLTTPATFKFNHGDTWYRTRTINIGNVILYDMVVGVLGTSTILGQKLASKSYSTTDYTIADVVTQQNFINNINSPGWTINVILNTYLFTVRGSLNLIAVNASANNFRIQIVVVQPAMVTTTYILYESTGAIDIGRLFSFDVSTVITIPPGSKIFLVMNCADANFRVNLVSGYLGYSEPSKDFTVGVIDENFSDFYESKVNSNGRPLVVNPNERQTFFGSLVRWGLADQQNTDIDQLNRFYPVNFDEIDRSKGAIQRFKIRERILRVFQNRACGQFGVYARFIQNNSGNPELVTTNDIITKNNINYYLGEFGLGDQYTALVSGKNQDYFVDPVRGYQVRLSDDGLQPISEEFKGQFYLRSLFIPYNKTWDRPNGGKAKILGCYDFFEEQYMTILQAGTENTDDSLLITTIDIHNPVAVDDDYTCYVNDTLSVPTRGIMINDTDDNPLTLTVQAGTFNTNHGVIIISSNGAIFYTPDADYVGADTYEYTLINQYGLTATANININVIEMEAGIILMWSGNPAMVPSGYALCDGTGGTPDLRGKFIVGYSAIDTDYNAIGKTGGAKTVTLDLTQIPSHTHPNAHVWNESGSGHLASGGTTDEGAISDTTGSSGGGAAHENRPPYYTLAYIIKL